MESWRVIDVYPGGELEIRGCALEGAGGIDIEQGGRCDITGTRFTGKFSSVPFIEVGGCNELLIERNVFDIRFSLGSPGVLGFLIPVDDNRVYRIYNNTFVGYTGDGVVIDFTSETGGYDRSEDVEKGVVLIYNNIFKGNRYGVRVVGCGGSQRLYVCNNCFYENEGCVHVEVSGCDVTMRDNLVGVAPLLQEDYTLDFSSPCIDAGNPVESSYYSPYDPDMSVRDIGAYYYDFVPGVPYLKGIVWTGGHPKVIWTHPSDRDIEKFVLAKTYTNSSGVKTWYVDIYGDTFYVDTDIDYVNPRFANTTATYRVKSVDMIGQESGYSNSRSVSGRGPLWKPVVDVPGEFRIYKPYPNPFNSTVEIRYDLPEGRHVRMEVYDIMGELVKVLVDRDESAGYMVELWDGRDDRGEYVPSGVYFVKVEIGDYRGIMKVVLVR